MCAWGTRIYGCWSMKLTMYLYRVSNRPVNITSVPLYAPMTWSTTAWLVCSMYTNSHIVQPISYSIQKLKMYVLGQKHVLAFILTHNNGENCLFWHLMVKEHLLQVTVFFPDTKEIVHWLQTFANCTVITFLWNISGFSCINGAVTSAPANSNTFQTWQRCLCCLTQLAKGIMNCCDMILMHQHLVPTKKWHFSYQLSNFISKLVQSYILSTTFQNTTIIFCHFY